MAEVNEKHSWSIVPHDRKKARWAFLIAVSFISLAVAAYLFFADNLFGTLLFILLPIILTATLYRGPKETNGHIDHRGITINTTRYPFEKIRYFALIDPHHLAFKPRGEELIYAPVHEHEHETIRTLLATSVKEKEEINEGFSEIFNRYLGRY